MPLSISALLILAPKVARFSAVNSSLSKNTWPSVGRDVIVTEERGSPSISKKLKSDSAKTLGVSSSVVISAICGSSSSLSLVPFVSITSGGTFEPFIVIAAVLAVVVVPSLTL